MDRSRQVTDLEWQLLIEKVRLNRLQKGEDVEGDLTSEEIGALFEYYQEKLRELEAELHNLYRTNNESHDTVTPTVDE